MLTFGQIRELKLINLHNMKILVLDIHACFIYYFYIRVQRLQFTSLNYSGSNLFLLHLFSASSVFYRIVKSYKLSSFSCIIIIIIALSNIACYLLMKNMYFCYIFTDYDELRSFKPFLRLYV